MSKKIKLISIAGMLLASILFVLSFSIPSFTGNKDIVVRAAVDIGSGATKLKVVNVNLKTQKITKVLADESFTVQYQEELDKSDNNTFNASVMKEGIEALKKSTEIAKKYGADKVVAVATASFRKAANAQEFIETINQETGIVVHVVDQDLEGALGFEATAAQLDADPSNIIVWDIGGGSYQFSTLNEAGELVVHRGLDASVPFKNRVIKQIKKENPTDIRTPNPLSLTEIKKAESHAIEVSKKVAAVFKEKIANPNTRVIGIGNIFAYRIFPLVEKKSIFTKAELSEKVYDLQGKKDSDLGPGDYNNVAVTNPILVLGFMDNLGIDEMGVMNINNADGALLYAPFWNEETLLA